MGLHGEDMAWDHAVAVVLCFRADCKQVQQALAGAFGTTGLDSDLHTRQRTCTHIQRPGLLCSCQRANMPVHNVLHTTAEALVFLAPGHPVRHAIRGVPDIVSSHYRCMQSST